MHARATSAQRWRLFWRGGFCGVVIGAPVSYANLKPNPPVGAFLPLSFSISTVALHYIHPYIGFTSHCLLSIGRGSSTSPGSLSLPWLLLPIRITAILGQPLLASRN